MGAAEVEIAFERIKEICDEETNWKLFYIKHLNDIDDVQKEMMQCKLNSLEKERELLIKSINMGG